MAQGALVGFFVAVLCFSAVHAACTPTQAQLTKVQTNAQKLAGALAPIASNITLVLETLCGNDTHKAAMTELQTVIGSCNEILVVPEIKAMLDNFKLGPSITFPSLFAAFESVDRFCVCAPNLPLAWMGAMGLKGRWNEAGGAYANMTNPAIACSPNATMLLNMVEKAVQNCPQIIQQSGFDTNKEFTSLKFFNSQICKKYDAQNFTCAKTSSMMQSFKSCIDHENSKTETSDDKADSKMCKRRTCVKTSFKNCTSDATLTYISSVNVVMNNQIAMSDGECSAASYIQIPLVLILAVTVLRSFL